MTCQICARTDCLVIQIAKDVEIRLCSKHLIIAVADFLKKYSDPVKGD